MSEWIESTPLLTRREYFVAMAMQACRAKPQSSYRTWEDLALDAIDIADATLAVLDATPPPEDKQ